MQKNLLKQSLVVKVIAVIKKVSVHGNHNDASTALGRSKENL
jgi:hypothetical protein